MERLPLSGNESNSISYSWEFSFSVANDYQRGCPSGLANIGEKLLSYVFWRNTLNVAILYACEGVTILAYWPFTPKSVGLTSCSLSQTPDQWTPCLIVQILLLAPVWESGWQDYVAMPFLEAWVWLQQVVVSKQNSTKIWLPRLQKNLGEYRRAHPSNWLQKLHAQSQWWI